MAFLRIWILVGLVLAVTSPAYAAGVQATAPSVFWMVPFIVLLGSIALAPFINKHWWEKWYWAVSFGLGAVVAGYYFLIVRNPARWLHGMEEYVSFIVLLGSLFIVSGGIVIHVARKATPAINSTFLLIGAVIANVFGTTGASMVLIRPFLRINKGHLRPFHIVFFIFIVSNVGGALTPIGDPPLFLGYLQGVPFWWVLEKCRWAWLLGVGLLVLIFFIIDTIDHGRTERRLPEDPGPGVHLIGVHNILFIALVLWGVFQHGVFEAFREFRAAGFSWGRMAGLVLSREILMIGAAVGSRLLTSKAIYERNEFSMGPIREVAILFVGIFSTMIPALQWLNANAARLPLNTPGQFYFSSGTLSAVLDNAPTYLTFLEVELGRLKPEDVDQVQREIQKVNSGGRLEMDPRVPEVQRRAIEAAVRYHGDAIRDGTITRRQIEVAFLLGDTKLSMFVIAVSLGSVFFGACTYIGNGPNFMVKSIADSAGVQTPSFIGYVLKYTLPVLIPVYVLVWYVFLR